MANKQTQKKSDLHKYRPHGLNEDKHIPRTYKQDIKKIK